MGKFIFHLENFSDTTRMDLSLAKQLMSPQKIFVINKVHYFDFLVSRLSFNFIFILNIVLRDSYQVDKVVMEIEEWKQKVPAKYVKSFIRDLLGVLETSILS